MDQSGTLLPLLLITPDEKPEVQILCIFSKITRLVNVRAKIQIQIFHTPYYCLETKDYLLYTFIDLISTMPGTEKKSMFIERVKGIQNQTVEVRFL